MSQFEPRRTPNFKHPMGKIINMAAIIGAACLLAGCGQEEKQEFKYTADQFADIKVIRYTVPGWDELSLQRLIKLRSFELRSMS